MGPNKQAGAELKKKKKGFFGAKIVEKIEYKGQKLINFQKKRKETFWANKKKLGLSLRRKRKIFWVKNWGKKFSVRDKK